jgi:hypothetical protein
MRTCSERPPFSRPLARAAWPGPPLPEEERSAATGRAAAPEPGADEVLPAPALVESLPDAPGPACAPDEDDDEDDGVRPDEAEGVDTDGTVPAGVWTDGVDTAGGAGAGALIGGVVTGGVLTGGTVTGGTGTGAGTGTVTGGVDTGGTVTWAGGSVVGTVTPAAPAGRPQMTNEIEVPSAATTSHQRRRSMPSP